MKYLDEPRVVRKPMKFDLFEFQSSEKLHQYQTQDCVWMLANYLGNENVTDDPAQASTSTDFSANDCT